MRIDRPAFSAPASPTSNPAWGWNKPNTLAEASSKHVYFERLASLVEEWFHVAPAAAAPNQKLHLVSRLLELRSGCTRLHLDDHPLPPTERDRLQARAWTWCKDIDVLIQNAQQANDLKVWIPAIDKLVRQMAADLRADQVD